MPHFILEYSANLDEEIAIPELFRKLHEAAIDTGVYPIGGIRSRAIRCDQFRIADGDPDQGFVHLIAKIGHGRDAETKKATSQRFFAVLTEHLDPIFQKRYLGISFEMMESPPEPELSYKKNNIHSRFK